MTARAVAIWWAPKKTGVQARLRSIWRKKQRRALLRVVLFSERCQMRARENADEGVEGGPDWSEDPVGWIAGWFVEGGEPVLDGGGGQVAAEAAE